MQLHSLIVKPEQNVARTITNGMATTPTNLLNSEFSLVYKLKRRYKIHANSNGTPLNYVGCGIFVIKNYPRVNMYGQCTID